WRPWRAGRRWWSRTPPASPRSSATRACSSTSTTPSRLRAPSTTCSATRRGARTCASAGSRAPPRSRGTRAPRRWRTSTARRAVAERLRVAQLTAVYPPYAAGGGLACAYQAAELARRGHDVHVYTVERGGPAPPTPATLHRLPAALQLGAAPLLPGLFRLGAFDVLHVHHPFIFGNEPALANLLRHRGTALVVSYHNRLLGNGLRRPLFWTYEETVGRALARRA